MEGGRAVRGSLVKQGHCIMILRNDYVKTFKLFGRPKILPFSKCRHHQICTLVGGTKVGGWSYPLHLSPKHLHL